MPNFKTFLSSKYLFSIDTVRVPGSDISFFYLGLVLVLLAAVLKMAAIKAPNPVDKALRNRFFRLLMTVGVWEVVWFGCRYEYIRFFGSHFVAFLGILVGLIWLGFIVLSLIKSYSSERQQWEKEQLKLKYLPK